MFSLKVRRSVLVAVSEDNFRLVHKLTSQFQIYSEYKISAILAYLCIVQATNMELRPANPQQNSTSAPVLTWVFLYLANFNGGKMRETEQEPHSGIDRTGAT